jgi:hypothetical protein
MFWFRKSRLARATRGERVKPVVWAGLGLAFLLAGCPVDERTLKYGAKTSSSGSGGVSGTSGSSGSSEVGEAGSPIGGGGEPTVGEGGAGHAAMPSGGTGGNSGGRGGAGSGGTGPDPGGEGGAAGIGPDLGAGGCGDMDQNDVQDCDETLVDNWRFDSDVVGWRAETTVTQQWDARNARNNQQSGAVAVTNSTVAQAAGVIEGGSEQCRPALGNVKYRVAARTLIPGGQGEGSARLSVWFYGADDCADYLLESAGPPAATGTDAWLLLQGLHKAPPATRSMRVRLVVAKPFSQMSFNALFDDILVREQ